MTSDMRSPFAIGLDEAACARLADIERHSIPVAAGVMRELRVALPKSYAKARSRRYPLVLLLDAEGLFGSAVEMSRLMSDTTEIRECIVVALPKLGGDPSAEAAGKLAASLAGEILSWCSSRYRVEAGEVALFGCGTAATVLLHALLAGVEGIDRYILGEHDIERANAVLRRFQSHASRPRSSGRRLSITAASGDRAGRATAAVWRQLGQALAGGGAEVSVRALDETTAATVALPALVDGLRSFWSTGKVYGTSVAGLRKPLLLGLLERLAPLVRRLKRRPPGAVDVGNPYLLRSERMARNFEIFVSLPASWTPASLRRYPALLATDANIEFSTISETCARMAAAGEMAETIVVGIGVPRSEGAVEFGFRRFEEMSPPPAAGYDWNDDLGRVFRGLFAMRGQDARRRVGMAPDFYGFIVDELLPKLLESLPIDTAELGLLGHSAGGTFVGYALYQANSPFRHYLAISPGVGISDSWMIQQTATGVVSSRAAAVALSMGSEEKANLFNCIAGIDRTEEFSRRLQSQQPQLDVRYLYLEGETHSSIVPRAIAQSLAAFTRRPVPESSIDRPVAA